MLHRRRPPSRRRQLSLLGAKAGRPYPFGACTVIGATAWQPSGSVNAVQSVGIEKNDIGLPDVRAVVPELDAGIDHDLERRIVLCLSREIDHAELNSIEDEIFVPCADTGAYAIVQIGLLYRPAPRCQEGEVAKSEGRELETEQLVIEEKGRFGMQ